MLHEGLMLTPGENELLTYNYRQRLVYYRNGKINDVVNKKWLTL